MHAGVVFICYIDDTVRIAMGVVIKTYLVIRGQSFDFARNPAWFLCKLALTVQLNNKWIDYLFL